MDTSKLKVGDVVHVRCNVEIVNEFGNAFVRAAPPQSGMRGWISPNAVAHVEPRPIQVGDKVRARYNTATVLAVRGNYAWIMYDQTLTGKPLPCTWELAELERVDA